MKEKRKAKRMPIDVTIKLKTIGVSKISDDANVKEIAVDLIDVSESGIAFVTNEKLEINGYYDIKMVIWEKGTFDTVIEIVRSENDGDMIKYGCRFIGIAPSDKFKIQVHEMLSEGVK